MAQITNAAVIIIVARVISITCKLQLVLLCLKEKFSKLQKKVLLCSLLHLRTDRPVISLNSQILDKPVEAQRSSRLPFVSSNSVGVCSDLFSVCLFSVCRLQNGIERLVVIELLLKSVASKLVLNLRHSHSRRSECYSSSVCL